MAAATKSTAARTAGGGALVTEAQLFDALMGLKDEIAGLRVELAAGPFVQQTVHAAEKAAVDKRLSSAEDRITAVEKGKLAVADYTREKEAGNGWRAAALGLAGIALSAVAVLVGVLVG